MLNKYTYILPQVEEIIDLHIENDSNFMFVSDFALTHYIYDYLRNEYDLEAESLELSSDVNEYYVSMSFYKDGDFKLFCEYAKWDQQGKYKYDESGDTDYYIFTDMSFSDAREYLYGRGEMQFCELVDEEAVLEEQMEQMEDLTEEDEQDITFVEKFASIIENSECQCGGHLRNTLYELLCTAKELGYAEAYEEMENDCDENEVFNIHIDSLNISNSCNIDDFLVQLKNRIRMASV